MAKVEIRVGAALDRNILTRSALGQAEKFRYWRVPDVSGRSADVRFGAAVPLRDLAEMGASWPEAARLLSRQSGRKLPLLARLTAISAGAGSTVLRHEPTLTAYPEA